MHAPLSPAPHPAGGRLWRPSERGDGRVLDLGRLLLGFTVVAFGVVFLLDSAGVLDGDKAIDRWWPLIIVAAGVFTLLERPPSVFRGVLFTGAGTLLLLFSTDVLQDSAWDYIWPALIIVAGITIVARWGGRTIPRGAVADDVVRATAIFGGQDIASSSSRFRGAWLTAVFGGITLDLRGAVPDPDGATVNATTAFGGVNVLVPKGWRVSIRSTPIFGGVDDKTDHSVRPADDAPVLRIDAVTVFGGVDVKHEK